MPNFFDQQTRLVIFRGCPLDSDYQHTISFASLTEQQTYFSSSNSSLNPIMLDRRSFQRADDNSMMISMPEWFLYNANYLAFQNVGKTNKVFYAFIDSVQYINPNTSQVTYTIDVMQSYMFDYNLLPCFVEREHPETDIFGENTVAEAIDLGPYYKSTEPVTVQDNDNLVICVACTGIIYGTETGTGSGYTYTKKNAGGWYGGVPCSCELTYYEYDHIDENYLGAAFGDPDPWDLYVVGNTHAGRPGLSTFIDEATKTWGADSIIGVYLIPSSLAVKKGSMAISPTSVPMSPFGAGITYLTGIERVWGFLPNNRKVLCYPYSYLSVVDPSGSETKYLYEGFDSATANFRFVGTPTPDAGIFLYPRNYKGQTDNKEEGLAITQFPMLPVQIDSFKAWLARNRGAIISSLATTAISGVGGVVAAGAAENVMLVNTPQKAKARREDIATRYLARQTEAGVGAAFSEFSNVADAIISGAQAASLSNTVKGNFEGMLTYASEVLSFRYSSKFILPYYAKMADEYFDMFGYATKRIKVPNINSRPYWNYVKTSNCHIQPRGVYTTDGMSAAVESEICSIYNNGITFWKYRQDMAVGDYSDSKRIANQAPHTST